MKKLFNALILTISLSSYFCYSQHELPNIIPPSPEAAQLGKYVESPVSYYNGTADISIPIFEFTVDGVTVPISLSYHSKGIQVGEIASRVGMGWTLSAGGAVTRQTRGIEDEHNGLGTGYYHTNFTSRFLNNYEVRDSLISYPLSIYDRIDMLPDLFMFNFLGNSGKFIIDHMDKKPIIQKYQDFMITGSPGGLFTITDSKGVKYEFGSTYKDQPFIQNSYTVLNSVPSAPVRIEYNYPNTWHLSRIITPNGEEINFNYEMEIVTYYQVNNYEKVQNAVSLNYTQITMFQYQLTSISHKNGIIYFDKDTNKRQDLQNGNALKKIRIRNNSQAIKTYVLNHSYRISPDDNNIFIGLKNVDHFAKKRLYLDSIDVYGGDNELGEKQTYSFEYNPLLLPNRHSTAQDNWGYFNGKNNGSMISYTEYIQANKQVDPVKAEAGMLKKINYPTGGYTEFEFEHNRVKTPSFFSQIAIPGGNNPGQISVDFGMIKDPNNWNGNEYIKQFTVSGLYPKVYFSNISFQSDLPCSPQEDMPGCRYDIFVKNLNGTQIYSKLLLGEGVFTLNPGVYNLVVKPRGNHTHHPNPHPNEFYPNEEFFVVIKTYVESIDSSQELLVAGKRIKKIKKGEGNDVLLTKEYLYTDLDGSSTGRLFSIPNYYQIHRHYGVGIAVSGSLMNKATPMSSFGGGQLGYQKVTEIEVGTENKGKTEYTFTVYPDSGEYYKFPYHIPTDMEWTRGLPLKISHFKYENSIYKIVKEVNNTYKFYDSLDYPDFVQSSPDEVGYSREKKKYVIPIYQMGRYLDIMDLSGVQPTNPDHYRTAHFIGGTVNLSKTIEIDYVESNQVSTEHNFTFDSTNHNFLTKKQSIVSDGIVETRYQYPWDVTSSGDVYQKMALRNIIDVPITTEVYRNSTKLSEQKIEYFEFNFPSTNDKLLLPNYIKTSKGSNSLENRIEYLQYDDVGNPLEVKQTNGTHIVYIWGYNKTMPIAKVENATYTQVSSYVSNLQTLSNGTNEWGLINALDTLRTNLPNALVTTYTYKPLVGVSSITDPRGYKTTYHYDSFGRLEFVKDHAGNIVQETKYNYQN